MDGRAQQPKDFAEAFEAAFARLQVLLELACTVKRPWSERVMVAVRDGLEFAASNPDAATVLTTVALAHGREGVERYERLMAYVAGLLAGGRAESPHGADLPETTERSLAGGVATIVANRVDRGRSGELPGLTVEMIQFLLTPYLDTKEARRIATAGDWPSGQSDR